MGKGGMRWGAGRPARKGKAEACLRLDVLHLRRRGALRPGAAGSWSWSNTSTGEEVGSIGYRTEGATLVLSYSMNGEARSQRVQILQTSCNYGGTRPWLGCPHCAGRVGVIYFRRGGFYCRKCAQVAYYSQSEDGIGRSWRVQRKAEAKLGEGWARPKGMHATTREKLLQVMGRCEERRDLEIERFLRLHADLLDWPKGAA